MLNPYIMTSLDKIDHARAAAPAPRHHLSLELGETLRLAVPMALTQLGQIAMMTTDLAFIGRLGNDAVAAAALAGTVYFISFTIGMGLVSAVAPLAAQAFGARDPRGIRRALRTGLMGGLADLAADHAVLVLPASTSCWRWARRRRRRIWRSNICSAWSGASRRRCGSWRCAALWAR